MVLLTRTTKLVVLIQLFIVTSLFFVSAQLPTQPAQAPEQSNMLEDKSTIVFQFYESSQSCNFGENYRGWGELECKPIKDVEVGLYDEKSKTSLISGLTNENGEVFFYSDELPEQFDAYYRKDGYYTDDTPNNIINQYGTTRFFTTILLKYTEGGFGHAEISLYDAKNQLLEIKENYLKGKGVAYVYLYDSNGNFVGQRDLIGMEEPIAIYNKLPVGTYEYYASVSGYEDSPRTTIEITKDSTVRSKAFLKPYETNRFIRFLKKVFGWF